ncbi:serine protease [Chitinophaga silvisoli]|uniref:Serine protease n=1 Tax=Chitinophaga silvisoli TaxID=2291814 RepID=A0A3E1P375_9BACT|nr:serine protease [Chitinophaga silvisoli]RFM34663.1 hypothetical protein DXN04_15470 [Chitinophaga silvisoli]
MSNPHAAHIEQSIISILNPDNEIIGYGFYIDPHGTAITCYHTIVHLTPIRIRDHDGNEFIATIDDYHTQYGAEFSDIAILQVPTATPTFLPLPITTYIGKEMTVINVNHSAFEFEDILLHKVTNPSHPPSSHGLPITSTGTIMAVGMLSVANYRNLPSLAIFQATPKSAQLQLLFQYLSDKYCSEEPDPKYRELKTFCNSQVRRAVRNLTEQKILLPNNFCNEPRIESVLNNFKEQSARVCCLLGESGIGKTNYLIRELPIFTGKLCTLFIAGQDLDPRLSSLPAKIKAYITQTLITHPHDTITIDDVMNLLYQHPEKCLIVIDGLNKIPRTSPKVFDDWFTRSIRWVRGMGLKLIITGTDTPTFQNGFLIDGFTGKQMKQAIIAYQLPEKFSKISRLNQPLLLRLHYDLGGQQLSAPLDDYPLLATWLSRKCTAIAARTQVSSSLIHSLLIDIAKHFVTSNDYWLSMEAYQHFLKDYPQLASILIHENLFIESVNGIRITQNWLADFLIGETFPADTDIDWEQLIPVSTATLRGGLPWLIAKKSFLGQDLSHTLNKLLIYILKSDHHYFNATVIFADIVRHLSYPDKYFTIIESFTVLLTNGYIFDIRMGPVIYNSHLSFPNQLKLFKICLSNEKLQPSEIMSYLSNNFHEKHIYLAQPSGRPTKLALGRYLFTDPGKTIAHITEWLYDCKDQEISMINIIACIIIYQQYSPHKIPFNPWIQDTPTQAMIIKVMISLILIAKESLVEQVYEELSQQRGTKKLVFEDIDAYSKSLPPILLNVYKRLPANEKKVDMTIWLLRIPEYRKEMINEILFLFKEGKVPDRLSKELGAYVTQDGIFELMVPMLVKYIKYGRDYPVRKECIPILFQFGKNEVQNRILANHLAALIQRGSDFDTHFTRSLVLGLYILAPSSAAYQTLLAMIPVLLNRNMHSWYHTLIYLCREEKNKQKRADKIKWIMWGFENLPERQLCNLVVLVLNMEIITDEAKILELIKPTILLTLKESDQFYDAVLKKCKKKNLSIYHDLANDEQMKALVKV